MKNFIFGIFFVLAIATGFLTSQSVVAKKEVVFNPVVNLVWPSPTPIPVGIPTQFSIPKLDVTVPVELVGLTENRAMAVPGSAEVVGWYKYGSKPGEKGSSVITGHYDSTEGPAIFYRLSELTVGDIVEVTDENGRIVKFGVVDKQIYKIAQFPIKEVFSDKHKDRLNLITCYGQYDKLNQTYNERLVVFSELMTDNL